MTLTISLVQDIIKVNPCTKFCDHTSNSLDMTVVTDTDRTIFIMSTSDAGCKKRLQRHKICVDSFICYYKEINANQVLRIIYQ